MNDDIEPRLTSIRVPGALTYHFGPDGEVTETTFEPEGGWVTVPLSPPDVTPSADTENQP